MTAVLLPESLTRGREPFEVALREALDRLHPRLRHVAAYHRGWVDADGQAQPATGGKLLRPALALLSAASVGADTAIAMPGAVASELVHEFSLLHDDLMDGDTERRHRPTAWVVFGLGPAVLAGDALLSLAMRVLQEVETTGSGRAERILTHAVTRLVHGQADDLDFESRPAVGVGDYLSMAADKTSALLACSASIGAALADAPADIVAGLAEYGEHLGLAFQLVDDMLGLWGDPAVTGKPVFSDLRARKKSAPVVLALAATDTGSEPLRSYLAGDVEPSEDTLRALADLITELGGGAAVTAEITRRVERAHAALDAIDIEDSVRTDLVAAAHFVTARNR